MARNNDVSGCKTVEECVQKAIKDFSNPELIRTVSVMDIQTMQVARYKVTFDNSKNGFALSEWSRCVSKNSQYSGKNEKVLRYTLI